jgi:hypothetical protein
MSATAASTAAVPTLDGDLSAQAHEKALEAHDGREHQAATPNGAAKALRGRKASSPSTPLPMMERQGFPGASRVAAGLAALVSSLANGAP